MNECIIWPGGDINKPIKIIDADGYHFEVVCEDGDTRGWPIFRIDGGVTIDTLLRITHLLGQAMVDGGLTAQTAARWAMDERLGKIVTGEAGDDR